MIVLLFNAFSLNTIGAKKVKMYLVEHEARYTIVPNISNIKHLYKYYIEIKESDVFDLFDNYADCKNNLMSRDTISNKYNACTVCAELYFGWRKLSVFFMNNGDYYFQGKWYRIYNELYFLLFSPFSNIVPVETLNAAEMKINSKNH